MKDKRTEFWQNTLQIAGVVAGVVAVFQQNDGLRIGSVFVAAFLFILGVGAAIRRARRRSGRLGRRDREVVESYFEKTLEGFLRELPLPSSPGVASYAERIRRKSAYVALSFTAHDVSSSPMLPPPSLQTQAADPVEFLTVRMRAGESVVVLGDPGSGKTLVAFLVFATLADEYRASKGKSLLPIFIRLNSLDEAGPAGARTPVQLLPQALQSVGDRANEMLHQGRACLILDGLDELPSTRAPRQVVATIPSYLGTLLDGCTLVTCREAFHNLYVDADRFSGSLGGELELASLSFDGQVVPFVSQYCSRAGRPEFAQVILGVIRGNPLIQETLSRPLMLRMTVDVLVYELDQAGPQGIEGRTLLTGSDYLSAEIYERYVVTWIKREHSRTAHPQFSPHEKLEIVERIAWSIFENSIGADAGYGSFELRDLLIHKVDLRSVVDRWLIDRRGDGGGALPREAVLVEVEERTFLIVGDGGESFRFAHKSFFEYLLARYVYDALAGPTMSLERLEALLRTPFPDEVIDFIRELFYWSTVDEHRAVARRKIEAALLRILKETQGREDALMSRQQSANLLPIVAGDRTREALRQIISTREHPFVRRAIAVGEALHHDDSSLLDDFVRDLDRDERAKSFHMGYNRIYYGDQPLSSSSFEDDGGADCSRFFRACVRHLELERYRHLRSMALATVRLFLVDPARRQRLLDHESEGLEKVRRSCREADPTLGPVYEEQRSALSVLIDEISPGSS